MNIILVSHRHGEARSFALGRGRLVGMALAGLMAVGAAVYGGYRLAVALEAPASGGEVTSGVVASWQERLAAQDEELRQLRAQLVHQVDALTVRLGEMQGRMLRLDALGQRLVESARLGQGEFDFDSKPALGGPMAGGAGQSYDMPDLEKMLASLDARIRDREKQLDLLDSLLANRELEQERFVAGRPIKWGWLSSHYGYRTDPFTGKRDWHSGVDLAGKEGSDIISVAAGVVTWSGDRYGYGNLVEIDHGNGLKTRYAHAKKTLVKVGEIVEKGQVIALMGSTGRSTGPHVHFEVLRNGKPVDPEKFIARARR